MPEQLIIGYNPVAATNRVAYYRGQIRSRAMWLVMAVVMCFAIWMWQRASFTTTQTLWLFGVGLGYSLIWLALAIVGRARAASALKGITPGVAMSVDRLGIWMQGTGMAWPDITGVAVRRRWYGGAPFLAVAHAGGVEQRIPLANLDVMTGTIDAAVRAYSSGVWSVDTRKLGN